MEGFLLTPPDRGTIIGKSLWKQRFVVVGPRREASASFYLFESRKDAHNAKFLPKLARPDGVFLSIYKSKDEWEPIQQHSISSITDCQIQMIAHRKQGPALPTMIIQISPDPATDKLRKRRSSRTVGLTSTKESGPTTLWFRAGDEQYTLNEWARHIALLIQPRVPERPERPDRNNPISPLSPASPMFINPFAPVQDVEFPMPPSSKPAAVLHKQASQTRRERPRTYTADSPSLRSRRSDLSSHASHNSSIIPTGLAKLATQSQQFSTVAPSDIPSPATTQGDYQGEYMLGWTSAQGRSPTVSSPNRGGSLSSQGQTQSTIDSGSPPGPRETILDRAFSMNCIPGAGQQLPGEEKLSSIARFEALMREMETRRRQEKPDPNLMTPMTSTWEEDDSEQEEHAHEELDEEEESEEDVFEGDVSGERSPVEVSAKRTLQYIASRHSTAPPSCRTTTMSYHAGTSRRVNSTSSVMRPHTSHTKPKRPQMPYRTHSQTHFSFSSSIDGPSAPVEEPDQIPLDDRHRHHHKKAQSNSSDKGASVNDLTKRFSSGSSSLLLLQTNVSTNSSRRSSEAEVARQVTPRGTTINQQQQAMAPPPRPSQKWRDSVGVFGSGVAGGFL